MRAATYHLVDLINVDHGGTAGAPLDDPRYPGETPVIDLAEWYQSWQQDPNGYWYVNLPTNSIVRNADYEYADVTVQIRTASRLRRFRGLL